MSQHPGNQKKGTFYERRKRLFSDLEEDSDEELLAEDNYNQEQDEDSKKNKFSKNLKMIANNTNFQSLRNQRLMKKYSNKENNILSQDQLDFAKKVVEQKTIDSNQQDNNNIHNNNNIQNNPYTSNIFSKNNTSQISSYKNLQFSSTHTFTIIDKKKEESNVNINNIENSTDELLTFLGVLCSVEYKILKNDSKMLILEVTMNKSEEEIMKFKLDFKKTGEDTEFVEYTPIITTFNLEEEDILFKEEIEIHKDDLGKMLKRLLIYKFGK